MGREKRNEAKKKKLFGKMFVFWFVLFLIIMVPAGYALDKIGDMRLFSGEEDLMEQMDTLVDPNSPFFKAFQDSQRVNVLLLGVNTGMTDTIMLGSYDMKHQHVDVISVPRDTYYERPGVSSLGAKKINSIYHSSKGGGAVGTAEAVSTVLQGMPIHYYVVVDYDGVKNIVDTIGGVPVTIPFHMYYHDPTDKPPLSIDIPEGDTLITSENVVQFLRFRKGDPGYPGYPEGDIGRVKAQQEFMKSAFRESLGLGFPKVVKTVLKEVDSDLNLSMALKIAAKAAGLEQADIETYIIPGEARTEGLSFYFPDEEKIKDMLTEIYMIGADDETEQGE